MMTRGDYVLITLLIVFSLGSLMCMHLFLFRTDASVVVIEVNGKHWAQYSITELHTPKEVSVETEFGSNLLLLERERVSVLQSNCPDKLEIKAGAITHAGQQLICLPNRLVIRLESSNNTKIDGVTY